MLRVVEAQGFGGLGNGKTFLQQGFGAFHQKSADSVIMVDESVIRISLNAGKCLPL